MSDKPKSPLGEIIQPFIDLAHAPRALWGINLAYVLEGMVELDTVRGEPFIRADRAWKLTSSSTSIGVV